MKHKQGEPTKEKLKRSFWSNRHFPLLACTVLFCTSGCTTNLTDHEYSKKLATARTDCTGKEIVGVWVSQLVVAGWASKQTLMLRPDGTGVMRGMFPRSDTRYLWDVTWKYVGGGIWEIEHRSQLSPNSSPTKVTVRYNGRELLEDCPGGASGHVYSIFVRGDDEAVVDEYLKSRKSS